MNIKSLKINKKHISFILSFIILVLFIAYFINNAEEFKRLKDVPPIYLILISILNMIVIFMNGIFLIVILTPFKKAIPLLEAFYISLLSSIGNYFTPFRGGAGIRAVYLNTKHNLSYSYFMSTLSGNYIVVFMTLSLLGLISLIIIQLVQGMYSIVLYLALGIVFAGMVFLSIVRIPDFKEKERNKYIDKVLRILGRINTGWKMILDTKGMMVKLVLLMLLNFLITYLITYIEFKAIGVMLSPYSIVLYASLSGLTLLFSITPGSLGIREAVFLFSASVLGVTNADILNVAVIDRGVIFFTMFILLIVIKLIQFIYKKTHGNELFLSSKNGIPE